jgi:hypothetical protein
MYATEDEGVSIDTDGGVENRLYDAAGGNGGAPTGARGSKESIWIGAAGLCWAKKRGNAEVGRRR